MHLLTTSRPCHSLHACGADDAKTKRTADCSPEVLKCWRRHAGVDLKGWGVNLQDGRDSFWDVTRCSRGEAERSNKEEHEERDQRFQQKCSSAAWGAEEVKGHQQSCRWRQRKQSDVLFSHSSREESSAAPPGTRRTEDHLKPSLTRRVLWKTLSRGVGDLSAHYDSIWIKNTVRCFVLFLIKPGTPARRWIPLFLLMSTSPRRKTKPTGLRVARQQKLHRRHLRGAEDKRGKPSDLLVAASDQPEAQTVTHLSAAPPPPQHCVGGGLISEEVINRWRSIINNIKSTNSLKIKYYRRNCSFKSAEKLKASKQKSTSAKTVAKS